MNCSLCNSEITDYRMDNHGKKYLLCSNCDLIQLDKELYLSEKEEKNRYLLHENSKENKGYLKYLNKIVEGSIIPFIKPGKRLLDFGCGPEKTMAGILEEKRYNISTYDPYFDNNTEWTSNNYDAITAIEVFEHLKEPFSEINRITKCLEPGSFLIIRTMLHNNSWDNFNKWWYKEDSTHISFFSYKTINFICKKWDYNLIQIKDQCEIVLRKKSGTPT